MLQSNYDKLNNYEYTNAELQKQLKKTELKLRQIQYTKLKDAQRQIKQKDQQIAELQKKLQYMVNDRGSSLEQAGRRGLNQSKSTKNNLPDYGRLSSGIRPQLDNGVRKASAVVREVDEKFEYTNTFGNQGLQYATDTQSQYDNAYPLNRNRNASQGSRVYGASTPMRLPNIKNRNGDMTVQQQTIERRKNQYNPEADERYAQQFDHYDAIR